MYITIFYVIYMCVTITSDINKLFDIFYVIIIFYQSNIWHKYVVRFIVNKQFFKVVLTVNH